MNIKGAAEREAQPAVRVFLFGSPRIEVAPGRVVRLSSQDGVIVAMVALDGPIARGVLAGRLWPHSEREAASNNLRKHVERIHKSIRANPVRSRFDALSLFGTAGPLSLVGGVRVDVREIDQMDVQQLLGSGDLLAGCDDLRNEIVQRWLGQHRRRLRGDVADRLAGCSEAAERDGRLVEALRISEQFVSLVPQHEHAWRRLMRQHYLRGDHTAAIHAFERFEALLRDDTGARPGEETLQLLKLIEQSQPVRAATMSRRLTPVSLVRPPVRVGRTVEWEAMHSAWSCGRAFMLVGDAGIGKSRLIDDCADHGSGMLIERGRPGDERSPYALLIRVLERIQDGCAPIVEPLIRSELARIAAGFGDRPVADGQQGALWRAVERFLQAATQRGVTALLIDDLHFADAGTVDIMRWLCGSDALNELRFGFATRPLDENAHAVVAAWLCDSRRPDRIDVRPLSREAVAELVATLQLPAFDTPCLYDRLYAHAGGHPFLTLETLKEATRRGIDPAGKSLPASPAATTLIENRLRELPVEARELLHVAAVAGADLTVALASALLDRSAVALIDAWSCLECANVLQGVTFVHDLIRQAALQRVPGAVRRKLHAAVASLLDLDPGVARGRVAAHWEAAGSWTEAGRAWFAAGQAARYAGRLIDQRTLLEQAARCHALAGDESAQFDAIHGVFEGLLVQSGGAAVLQALPRLEALARTTRQHIRCRLIRADALIELERFGEATTVASLALADAGDDPEAVSDALCLQGMGLVQTGLLDDAIAAERRAVAVARDARLPFHELRAGRSLGYVLYAAGSLAGSLAAHRETLALADALGDVAEAASLLGHLAALLNVMGDSPASYAAAVRARAEFVRMGVSMDSAMGCVNLIVIGSGAMHRGAYDEAMDAFNQALRIASDAAAVDVRAKARLSLASLWLTLGCPHEALAHLAELPDEAMPAMRMRAELLSARAKAMAGLSDDVHLARLAEVAARHPDLPLVRSAWFEWSYQGEARSVVERLRRVRALYEAEGCVGVARMLMVRETARLNKIDTDEAIVAAHAHADALRPWVAEGASWKIYQPEAWLVLADAYTRAGRRHAARDCLADARAWIIHRALPRVPEERKASFLERNPANRRVLAAPID